MSFLYWAKGLGNKAVFQGAAGTLTYASREEIERDYWSHVRAEETGVPPKAILTKEQIAAAAAAADFNFV